MKTYEGFLKAGYASAFFCRISVPPRSACTSTGKSGLVSKEVSEQCHQVKGQSKVSEMQ